MNVLRKWTSWCHWEIQPVDVNLVPILHNQSTSNSLTIPTGHDKSQCESRSLLRLEYLVALKILLNFCRVLLKMKTMTFWKEKLLKMMVWLKLHQILTSPTHGALWAALAPLQTVTCPTHCDADNQKGKGWKLCAMFCSGKRLELNFPNWQMFKLTTFKKNYCFLVIRFLQICYTKVICC